MDAPHFKTKNAKLVMRLLSAVLSAVLTACIWRKRDEEAVLRGM